MLGRSGRWGDVAGASYYLAPAGSVTVSNQVSLDMSISALALGLLVWIRARPAGASQSYREFLSRGFGEVATRRALVELEAAGYRWRFVERRDHGRIVTATLLFDRPATEDEAREVLEGLSEWPIGKCLSGRRSDREGEGGLHSAQQSGLSDRAEDVSARSDKGKHKPQPAAERRCETPSGTVQRSTEARSAVARSTVPRCAEAQPSNDGSNGWETDVSQPNQTTPVREQRSSESPLDRALPAGPVGSGLEGLLEVSAEDIAADDWTVLVECLPVGMRHVEPSAVSKIAAALRARLEAGWSSEALRATLAGNALPPADEIRNLAGIVSYRIGQTPIRPPKRQRHAPTSKAADPVRPTVMPLALQKRAEARSAGSPDANQPLSWWFSRYPPQSAEGSEPA